MVAHRWTHDPATPLTAKPVCCMLPTRARKRTDVSNPIAYPFVFVLESSLNNQCVTDTVAPLLYIQKLRVMDFEDGSFICGQSDCFQVVGDVASRRSPYGVPPRPVPALDRYVAP